MIWRDILDLIWRHIHETYTWVGKSLWFVAILGPWLYRCANKRGRRRNQHGQAHSNNWNPTEENERPTHPQTRAPPSQNSPHITHSTRDVVFVSKISSVCPNVKRKIEGKNEVMKVCTIAHKRPFVECTKNVVYQIPLDKCERVLYIGQTGRCLNIRLMEHASSLKGRPFTHLATHCKECGCTPLFDKTVVLFTHHNQTSREIVEAFHISKHKTKCVSHPSVALLDKEIEMLSCNVWFRHVIEACAMRDVKTTLGRWRAGPWAHRSFALFNKISAARARPSVPVPSPSSPVCASVKPWIDSN